MKKQILMSAFMLGSMLTAATSFAGIDKTVTGKATFEHIEGSERQYNLSCDGTNITCYNRYTDGTLGINDRGNIIVAYPVRMVQPTQPVFTPNPEEQGAYYMDGSLSIELMPGESILP